jgi:hypothetical protein
MSGLSFCDPYLWEDPRYLVRSIHKTDIKCASEMVNKAFFVYAVSILFAFVVSSLIPTKGLYIVMGLVSTLYLLPTFMKLRAVEEIRKGTPSSKGHVQQETEMQNKPYTQAKEGFYVEDTSANPFENVTVDQYKYAPTRGPAEGKTDLDAFFRVQWSSDPTDVFGKTQSQRMFYTTPNTTIPNDQGSYQDWLYKIPGLTCKEGNGAACVRGSEGAPIPWLNL